jgi:hypothetical protein
VAALEAANTFCAMGAGPPSCGAERFRERNSSKMAVLLLSYGSIGSHSPHLNDTPLLGSIVREISSVCRFNKAGIGQALPNANLLKIHFHISSLGQINLAPRNFPLIAGVLLPFSSLALFAILHVGREAPSPFCVLAQRSLLPITQ